MEVPDSKANTSIIIINWNGGDLILDCLRDLHCNADEGVKEIIVFDNDSADGSPQAIEKEFPEVRLIISSDNLGFGYAINKAAEQATGENLLILNPDMRLASGEVTKLLERFESCQPCGFLTCKIRYPNGKLQTVYGKFPSLKYFFQKRLANQPNSSHSDSPSTDCFEVEWVTGSLMLIKATVFRGIGGFDKDFFLYGEEFDISKRAQQAGYTNRYFAGAEIMHISGGCSGNPPRIQAARFLGMLKYYQKHNGLIQSWIFRSYVFTKGLINTVSKPQGDELGPLLLKVAVWPRYRTLGMGLD